MNSIKEAIDNALKEMSKEKIFMMIPGDVPAEMFDKSIEPMDDWRGWKPVDSIITDEDIKRFEKKIGVDLPLSYKEYLKYKHFFRLKVADIAVDLFSHLPDKNLTQLDDHIFNYHEPELVIGRKYIYIADFHDYGLLCFDANKPAKDNEYRIVYIDHEDLEDVRVYADNFTDLLKADSERGNEFIDKMNEDNK